MKTKIIFYPGVVLYTCIIAFVVPIIFQSCRKVDALSPAQAISASSISELKESDRPNIIFILADDVGYGAITCNGGETFKTPNIDKLATEGMRFTECFTAPLCSPSRFMCITGKYNFRNYTRFGVMDPNESTMATLLRDAGYSTYVAGKWQFDGGDKAIHSLGFDDYSVWNPFSQENGNHYKDPVIYENGNYLPNSETNNKYGDDIFTDNVLSFINRNKSNNFFVYFPITLCHYPYSPTPDDPEFPTWNSRRREMDTMFFPSMVKYMDKKIGQVVDSLKAWNLYNNTILVFAGDNGTPNHIWFTYDGVYQEGGKSKSNESGTHVPLIVTWPNGISAGSINDNLIDFTDFVPTFADAAGTTIPSSYGTIDGVSFFNQLKGLASPKRDWVFCHYEPNTNNGNDRLKRWINNTTYKLYDNTGRFYNIARDPKERRPIEASDMTPDERELKNAFQETMNTLK